MQDAHETEATASLLDAMIEDLRQEIATTQAQRKEIGILIRQTSTEIERLAQKIKEAASRVQHVEASPDSFSRAEVKQAYEASQEAQMRQFMMRSQLEQFSYRDSHLERSEELLNQLLKRACAIEDTSARFAAGGEGLGSAFGLAGTAPADRDPAGAALAAIEMSHQRLSRQLQDNTAQTLSDLVLRAEVCERLMDMDQQKTREELAQLRLTASSALKATRRLVHELRPPALDEQGLAPAVRGLAGASGLGDVVDLDVSVEGTERRLPAAVELALFRMIEEILAGMASAAGSTHAELSLWFEPERLVATVKATTAVPEDGAGTTEDVRAEIAGSTDMQTWAKLAGVAMSITSGSEGSSIVRLTVPY